MNKQFISVQTRTKKQTHKKNHIATQSQKQAIYSTQQFIMETPLDILEHEIALQEDPEMEIIPEDVESEEEDAEVNDWDDDESDQSREEDHEVYELSSAYPGEPISYDVSPVINPFYVLNVANVQDGKRRCFYEPPSWFTFDGVKREYKSYVKNINKFLHDVCEWFNNQQEYLIDPSPLNYFKNEGKFPQNPHQKGFVAKIEKCATYQGKRYYMTEHNFSRLADRIWLIWEDQCMPLINLFSDEYRLAWAVKWALFNDDINNWNIREVSTTREEKKQLNRKSIQNMDRTERLIYVADRSVINKDVIISAISGMRNG